MKYLIAGRSGVGKDKLKEVLEGEFHWSFVKSFTTREKRDQYEDTHIFINKEEAATIDDSEKIAKTVINGHEYFATKEQITECDAYIIDPKGIDMLFSNMPDESFTIIYIRAKDPEKQKEMAINRATDKSKEADIFIGRIIDEDKQFTLFEERIAFNKQLGYKNCADVREFINTYDMDEMRDFANVLNNEKEREERLKEDDLVL